MILHYLEESWLGKTQNKVNGVIFTYDPEQDNRTRIKDVPEKDILGKIEGCWHDQIYYTLSKSKVMSFSTLLVTNIKPTIGRNPLF